MIATSSWNLLPCPHCGPLRLGAGGPGRSPHLLCRQPPGGSGLRALEEPRRCLETTPVEGWWGRRVACAGGGGGGGSGTGFGLGGRSARRDRVAYAARVHLGKDSEFGFE